MPIASQGTEIDRRSFYALPVPSKPHNGARNVGPESLQYPNSSENIIAPPKPVAVTVWNTNDNSNRNSSEVRDSSNANSKVYTRSRTPHNSKADPMQMGTSDNTNSVSSKANPMQTDMPDNANSLVQCGSWRTDNPLYDSKSAQNVRSEVQPSELIELGNAHEQITNYAQVAPHANYVNFVPINDSYRYSEPITANGTPIVRWNEPPSTGSNPRRTTHTPITQTPNLFTPDESVYYTARQTDRCSRERPTNTDIRERRTLCKWTLSVR